MKAQPVFRYPDSGSNRDGLPHWCLRPARLPIPPSGQECDCKVNSFWGIMQIVERFFDVMRVEGLFMVSLFIEVGEVTLGLRNGSYGTFWG